MISIKTEDVRLRYLRSAKPWRVWSGILESHPCRAQKCCEWMEALKPPCYERRIRCGSLIRVIEASLEPTHHYAHRLARS